MPLTDAERDSLVRLLAARLPAWGARADVARACGLGDVQLAGDAGPVWGTLVDEAIARDAVGALVAAAARARPEDAELGAMARSAAEGALVVPHVDDSRAWVRGALIASACVVLIGVGALAYDLTFGTEAAHVDAVVTPTLPVVPGVARHEGATAQPEDRVEPVVDAPAATEGADGGDAASDGGESTPAAPSDASPLEDPVDEPALDAPAPDVSSDAARGPCASPMGERVGFAYAGTVSPGSKGGTWTVPRGLNVRADHPRRDNGWNSRTRVVCVLPKGARVRLIEAPVAVDGGAFWVPIHGGSVRTGSN